MKKMNILLVSPINRKQPPKKKNIDDDLLQYPPLGLLKIGRYHKNRGDNVKFVVGKDNSLSETLFNQPFWDRIYISTLFTFDWKKVIDTIKFYLFEVGGSVRRVYVGGIMASLMTEDIASETQIRVIPGILSTSNMLGFDDDVNIDTLPPDYNLIDKSTFAINDTYYAYTSRGCINKCPWCGVPKIEPEFQEYIDIKDYISSLRNEFGDKSILKLMDNNVLASPRLENIIKDLSDLGYGIDNKGIPSGNSRKKRVVDFNQGVDASFINKETIKLLSKINIKPLRIAFDRFKEADEYESALRLAKEHGFKDFSNYMLYNFKDTPKDLYERLIINVNLNQEWRETEGHTAAKIYSYPMRFAPIFPIDNKPVNRKRDYVEDINVNDCDWLNNPKWTKKFIRNVEVMKSAANGAISTTPLLARRTIGHDFFEFLTNLYMPEELLRYRDKYEKRTYHNNQRAGNGKIEEFRDFILDLIKRNDSVFEYFHNAVSMNTIVKIREAYKDCPFEELKPWLELYLKRDKKGNS